ncbi:TPA: AAA family ATPase, partial [Escherichia coli]|nr:ParA family protein [Escherichia coli]
MRRDYGSVGTIALRASALLQAMSRDIEAQRKEFNLTQYHQTYTRNAVAKLPKLSRRIVELAVKEMEDSGYEFNKKQVGNVEQYALTIQNVIDIYAHRQ